MFRVVASCKKLFFVAFFYLVLFPVFSQTVDRFDINFDSFEHTKEFEEKIELYKNSYSFYKVTIKQIVEEDIRSRIYAKEVESVRLKETDRIREEERNEFKLLKEKEVKEAEEKIKKTLEEKFENNKDIYKKEVRESLTAEYEEKKDKEVTELKEILQVEHDKKNQSLKDKYDKEFENKCGEFLDKAKSQAREEMDSEYEQKLNDYIKEINPKLVKQAYIDTKASTERFKTVALYVFIVTVLIVFIVSIMTVLLRKRKLKEQSKKEEEQRIRAEEYEKEQKKLQKEQKEKEFKLLIRKHYEYLIYTKGDKASCIDYFTEHYPDRTLDSVLEYKAYMKAVEMYEHPTIAMKEGE